MNLGGERLTVAGALGMLAEDLGMVHSRPGSWEGSNMAQVVASHGYNSWSKVASSGRRRKMAWCR